MNDKIQYKKKNINKVISSPIFSENKSRLSRALLSPKVFKKPLSYLTKDNNYKSNKEMLSEGKENEEILPIEKRFYNGNDYELMFQNLFNKINDNKKIKNKNYLELKHENDNFQKVYDFIQKRKENFKNDKNRSNINKIIEEIASKYKNIEKKKILNSIDEIFEKSLLMTTKNETKFYFIKKDNIVNKIFRTQSQKKYKKKINLDELSNISILDKNETNEINYLENLEKFSREKIYENKENIKFQKFGWFHNNNNLKVQDLKNIKKLKEEEQKEKCLLLESIKNDQEKIKEIKQAIKNVNKEIRRNNKSSCRKALLANHKLSESIDKKDCFFSPKNSFDGSSDSDMSVKKLKMVKRKCSNLNENYNNKTELISKEKSTSYFSSRNSNKINSSIGNLKSLKFNTDKFSNLSRKVENSTRESQKNIISRKESKLRSISTEDIFNTAKGINLKNKDNSFFKIKKYYCEKNKNLSEFNIKKFPKEYYLFLGNMNKRLKSYNLSNEVLKTYAVSGKLIPNEELDKLENIKDLESKIDGKKNELLKIIVKTKSKELENENFI